MTPTAQEEERRKFEEWALSKRMSIEFCDAFNSYRFVDTEDAWEIWRASRAQQSAKVSLEWQPVRGWEGRYWVTPCGRIFNQAGQEIGQYKNDNGYMLVRLSSPRKEKRVHRIVAEAYIDNPAKLPCINHLDCDRTNNKANNLEWCTQNHNIQYAHKLGRMYNHPKGKPSPNRSLTNAQVLSIKRLRAKGLSYQAVAERIGTNKKTVMNICNGVIYV